MKLILARPNLISWEDAYKTRPPWDIGRPQPAFVELVQAGELNQGRVLDVGCGSGENARYLAERGFSVIGGRPFDPRHRRSENERQREEAESGFQTRKRAVTRFQERVFRQRYRFGTIPHLQ